MRNSNDPILLLEDDTIDILTINKAFTELNILNPVINFKNGEEAVEYLSIERQKPCIVIMDINMPRMNGLEFLEKVRKDCLIVDTPVVVLTTSNEEGDIKTSFRLGASGYMLKPLDYQSFREVIKDINKYWTSSELPN